MYSYGGLLFVALYPNSPPVTSEDGGIEVGEHANVDVAVLVRKLVRKEAKERPSASEALAYPLFAAAGAALLAKVHDQQREVERLRQEHHAEEQMARTELEQKRRALAEEKRNVQEQLREE
jgi:activator of 2-hydroxyglutaryl-CoA dehydratase